MKKNKILSLICLLSFSISGFNIIPLDESLKAHQKAFKDFEPYASSCSVDVSYYGSASHRVTKYNYYSSSLQAKRFFQNYRKAYKNLINQVYINSILKSSIIGLVSTYYDQFSNESLFNDKSISLHFLLSALIVMDENINMGPEPYFSTGTLNTHSNIFGAKEVDTWMRIFIAMFTIEYIRMIGALTCFRNYNKRFF